MKLSPAQQTISDDSSRFRIAACGRRFGKSYLAMNEMAKFARYPRSKILAVAPTYKQCKNIWWNDLKGLLLERNWVKKINESELMITLVNNSTITLRSSENHDALRGGKYDFIVLDEFADMNPVVWNQVLRPTLSDRGGHALFIGSPKGRNHMFDLWTRAGSTPDWSAYQYTTLDGGNVPPEEIEAARRDLGEREFEQEYLAQFVNYAGVIFYAFTEENMVKFVAERDGWNERTPLHIGIDFNTSPITASIAVKGRDWLHIIDEVEIYGSNTLELVQEIRNRYPNRQYYAYPDATGSRKNTNSMGMSDHIILSNNGFKVITDKINPNVNDSIASVNSLLCNGSGERKLLIDPSCKKIRECMLRYVYKEGTRIPNKDGIFDHFADNIRYLVHRLFPVKQIPIMGTHKLHRRI